MADIEVTLNHSENYSSSTAKTYRGYIINLCDDSHVDDGTWAVTSNSYTGYKINSNKIDVWNINTTSSDKSATFTWTSSKVDGCTKTLKVTVPGAVVTLKSGNTEIVVTAYYSTSTGDYNIYSCQDEFLINGSSNGIVTTSNTVGASPIITCKGGMSEYWINYAQNNTDNKIHVSLIPSMSTYFIGCTGDYNATGTNTINLEYYESEMSISFPVTFKFIYKEVVQEQKCVEFSFQQDTYTVNFSAAGHIVTIILNITNWGNITEENYETWGESGNHLSLTTSSGTAIIKTKTLSASKTTFSIDVMLTAPIDINATITCKDVVCNTTKTCTIDAIVTKSYGISIKYTMSDTKSVAIRGTLASTTFSLDRKNTYASTQKQAGSYKLNIQTLDITVNATFAAKYLGLFKTEDNITTLLTDIADVSSVKSVSKSNINYNFAVTDYSISFEIIPYNPATGHAKCYLNVGNNGNYSNFKININIGKYKLLDNHFISSSMPTEKLTFNFFDKFKVYDLMNMGYVSFSITGGEQNSDNKISIDIDENLTTNHHVEYIDLSSYSNYTYSVTTDVSIRSDAVLTITIADYN